LTLPSTEGATDIDDDCAQSARDQPTADQRQYQRRISAQEGLSFKQVDHHRHLIIVVVRTQTPAINNYVQTTAFANPKMARQGCGCSAALADDYGTITGGYGSRDSGRCGC
jgi:hypothetical protein